MSADNEPFLSRWSRLKQEQASEQEKEKAAPPAETKQEAPVPALPPVADLKPDSDFKPFMDSRVDLETRRSALKKLFTDGHFKTHDPFEPYSIDLTGEDPIPPEMLKTLDHARRILFDEKKEAEKTEQQQQASEQEAEKPLPEAKDVSGKQDA